VLSEARAAGQSIYAKDFWLREPDGALHDIGPFEPPADTAGPPGNGQGVVRKGGGEFWGASSDLSHVLFEISVAWPGDEGYGSLYEYAVGQDGPPVPVGVEPNGDPCPSAQVASYQRLSSGSTISADGSTVFFTCSGNLLARIDEARTVAISRPSKVDCEACDTEESVPQLLAYDGSSADGSRVFFTTTQPLLGSTAETSANIYEYDFDAPQASAKDPNGRIVQVTAGKWGSKGAQGQSVVKVSEDGSHVYFLAAGKLEGARNSQGKEAVEKESNLYVYDTETGTTAFVATVSPGNPSVTPDGQFLVFTSNTPGLTPGDTSTANQVFEYDAGSGGAGSLTRVSIGQDGFNDNGNTDTFGAEIPEPLDGSQVAVSDDGAYVVFQSADGLTPQALNGVPLEHETAYSNYAENVYEYHDGNVYLISDGQDASYSPKAVGNIASSVRIEGLSPSGADVFFETADRLVSQDVDTGLDMYDARIDGGFPAAVSSLPTCSGDACQGQLSPAPTLLSPGSESQAGETPPLLAVAPGPALAKSKPKAKGCKNGYVRKKTSCVKVKTGKKTKAIVNTNAKGRKKHG
jgi:Tol biopolymer transport system component